MATLRMHQFDDMPALDTDTSALRFSIFVDCGWHRYLKFYS